MTGVNKKGESLCERFMKMVVNIIKFSSFSNAKMSVGGGIPGLRAPVKIITPTKNETLYSQEPHGISKNVSYLIYPDEGTRSSFMHHKRENIDNKASKFIDRVHLGNVDGRASDYIDRVHKKNQHSFLESSGDSPFILPPPPRVMK